MSNRSRMRSRKRAAVETRGPASAGTAGGAGIATTATNAKPKAKYNANGRFVGSQWCASEAEAVRYEQLLVMQATGLISKLECQPKYTIVINNVKICDYWADFRFFWHGPDVIDPRGLPVVEEVKGLETPAWKLKKKLVEAIYQFSIRVITKLSGSDWDDRPKLSALLVGKKSSFAEQLRVRYADRITDLSEDEIA